MINTKTWLNKPRVTVEEVVANPLLAAIDEDPVSQAFLACDMVKETSLDYFEPVVDYILRPEFPAALEIMVMCLLVKNNPKLLEAPPFAKWAKESKHLGF